MNADVANKFFLPCQGIFLSRTIAPKLPDSSFVTYYEVVTLQTPANERLGFAYAVVTNDHFWIFDADDGKMMVQPIRLVDIMDLYRYESAGDDNSAIGFRDERFPNLKKRCSRFAITFARGRGKIPKWKKVPSVEEGNDGPDLTRLVTPRSDLVVTPRGVLHSPTKSAVRRPGDRAARRAGIIGRATRGSDRVTQPVADKKPFEICPTTKLQRIEDEWDQYCSDMTPGEAARGSAPMDEVAKERSGRFMEELQQRQGGERAPSHEAGGPVGREDPSSPRVGPPGALAERERPPGLDMAAVSASGGDVSYLEGQQQHGTRHSGDEEFYEIEASTLEVFTMEPMTVLYENLCKAWIERWTEDVAEQIENEARELLEGEMHDKLLQNRYAAHLDDYGLSMVDLEASSHDLQREVLGDAFESLEVRDVSGDRVPFAFREDGRPVHQQINLEYVNDEMHMRYVVMATQITRQSMMSAADGPGGLDFGEGLWSQRAKALGRLGFCIRRNRNLKAVFFEDASLHKSLMGYIVEATMYVKEWDAAFAEEVAKSAFVTSSDAARIADEKVQPLLDEAGTREEAIMCVAGVTLLYAMALGSSEGLKSRANLLNYDRPAALQDLLFMCFTCPLPPEETASPYSAFARQQERLEASAELEKESSPQAEVLLGVTSTRVLSPGVQAIVDLAPSSTSARQRTGMMRPSEMRNMKTKTMQGVDGAFEKKSWEGTGNVTEFDDMHDRAVDMLAKLLYEVEIVGESRAGLVTQLINSCPLPLTQSRLKLLTSRLVRLVTARRGYSEECLESIFYIVSVLHMIVSASPRWKEIYVTLCNEEVRLVLANPALYDSASRDALVENAYVPFEELVLDRLKRFVNMCLHPTKIHAFKFRSDIY